MKPDEAQLHHMLGMLYELSGDRERAVERYEDAIRYRPDFAEAKNNLAYIYAESGDNLDRALDRNPILVTALNPVIGYEMGAAVAKKAYAEGRPVKDVAREMTDLSDEELDRLLDPATLAEGGIQN